VSRAFNCGAGAGVVPVKPCGVVTRTVVVGVVGEQWSRGSTTSDPRPAYAELSGTARFSAHRGLGVGWRQWVCPRTGAALARIVQ
jgi:hypothetical protein